ncbi:MAG: hypothetical protein O2822_06150 [Chloroflexi bacterium]|nr:hypothetical protein [Chloroflexota bacterium]
MTSEEGMYQNAGYPGHQGSGEAGGSAMNEPAAWPRAAEEVARRGWWPSLLAAGGSLVTVIGAVLLARRRSKRSGLMAAIPTPLAEASEQMMRARGNGGSSNPLRTILAVALFALAGWGIRRRMAHQAS